MDKKHTFTLNNGTAIPALGFGTFKIEPQKAKEMAASALEAGYRHIDTAAFYQNEEGIGQAIAESAIPREEIFLTTKVWMDDLGREKTLKAFETSLKKLRTDYLDLYLIHWPRPLAQESWKVMEGLYQDGKIRAIGVSNYIPEYLDRLIKNSSIVPAVNQIELHPGLQQNGTVEYCKNKGIVVEAWSPIMKGQVLEMNLLKEIGAKYGKTPVQVTLRWHLQRGVVVIPKSSHPDRIKANIELFDFELTKEEMTRIESLDSDTRLGFTPQYIYENGFKPKGK